MAGGCAPLLSGGYVPVAGAGILLAGVVVLPGGRWMCPVAGAGILQAGVVVLPGGWWMCPRGWWCLLASSPAYSQPDT